MNPLYILSRILILSLVLLTWSCKDDSQQTSNTTPSPQAAQDYRIVNRIAHDAKAFTQGLEYHEGIIYESTGQYGSSWISTYDLGTLEYEKKAILNKKYFGEGMTLYDGKIYQLTYKAGKMMVYDAETYAVLDEYDYSESFAEGWGLSNNGEQLIISDGTSTIYFMDPSDYSIAQKINVKKGNQGVRRLNELEYVDGSIYANIWQTNTIVKINPNTGDILQEYDLSSLYKMINHGQDMDVLNGIAYNSTKETFYVTGKYWPYLFEIKLLK